MHTKDFKLQSELGQPKNYVTIFYPLHLPVIPRCPLPHNYVTADSLLPLPPRESMKSQSQRPHNCTAVTAVNANNQNYDKIYATRRDTSQKVKIKII